MLGHLGPDQLSVAAVHRFLNDPVRVADGLHWNILELYRNILVGLRKAVATQPDLAGVGIDSWAVDYGLLSGDRLINNPFHYRDERTARGVDLVHKIADHAALHTTNGLQFQPFNSIYQLAVDHDTGVIDDTTRMLMIPDLLGFWLTGEQVAERTNASTTGLLDVTNGAWNATLIDKVGLPRSLFPALVDPGTRIGSLRDDVAAEVGAAVDVIAVGSHDTASAVVGVPMTEPGAAYVSSGTWSLVGVELDRPVLTEESREANFTNEGGVDGTIRYLRNVMGMWLLSESIRTWERAGQPVELTALLNQAAEINTPVPIFDANHPSLLPPGDMPKRIAALCAEAGAAVPHSPAEFARSIVESLAAHGGSAYAVDVTSPDVRELGLSVHVGAFRREHDRIAGADDRARELAEEEWFLWELGTLLEGMVVVVETDADDLLGLGHQLPAASSCARQPASTACTLAAPMMGSSGAARRRGWRMNGSVCGPPIPPWNEISSSNAQPSSSAGS